MNSETVETLNRHLTKARAHLHQYQAISAQETSSIKAHMMHLRAKGALAILAGQDADCLAMKNLSHYMDAINA